MCIVNAFGMYRLSLPARSEADHKQFRLTLIDQMLAYSTRLGDAPIDVAAAAAAATNPPTVKQEKALDEAWEAARAKGKLLDPHRPKLWKSRRRGQQEAPDELEVRSSRHLPILLPDTARFACDFPGCKATRIGCICTCGVRLCIMSERNCFTRYHDPLYNVDAGVDAVDAHEEEE
jgi:hypothetical protein